MHTCKVWKVWQEPFQVAWIYFSCWAAAKSRWVTSGCHNHRFAFTGRCTELEDAPTVAEPAKAQHIILSSDAIEPEIKMNPVNRCYFCKKVEYGDIIVEASKLGLMYVDGSNYDDLKDTRPGMKARDELKVISAAAGASDHQGRDQGILHDARFTCVGQACGRLPVISRDLTGRN